MAIKIKELSVGDKVNLKTREKEWQGTILESHDPEVILLKLSAGYNIGIRENEILDVKITEKAKEKDKLSQRKGELGHTAPESLQGKNLGLPKIAMIITGGTISSRLDPKTGGVISTDAEEILKIAPEIKNICNIVKIEKPFMKWSENMSFLDWKKLAELCEKLLNEKDKDKQIDGIIITHGTDFLHYTSAALSFYLRDLNKPIALTYSQRSIDRGSTDAALNLICAARYAVSDIAEVAIVGHKDLNDTTCIAMPGTKTRKMHTSRRDAFKIINDTPLAEITKDKIKILKNFNARDNQRQVKLDAKYTDKIAIVKIYPGQNPNILDFYAKEGYKGLVLELAGLGHAPSKESKENWLPTIKKTIQKGITIVGTAQTIYGELNMNVYSAGRELQDTGIISLRDMTSETAFVKLSWILGHSTWAKDKEKINEKLLENISGEFNDKLGFEDFN